MIYRNTGRLAAQFLFAYWAHLVGLNTLLKAMFIEEMATQSEDSIISDERSE